MSNIKMGGMAMKTDLLAIKYKTFENLNILADSLIKQYPLLKGDFEKVLESESITIKLLGKVISIPYYNRELGNIVNKEQIQANIEMYIEPVFDKVTYTSLAVEDIRARIMEKFTATDKIYNEP